MSSASKPRFTPCYNYTPFHGAGIVVLNQELASLLADYLQNSALYASDSVLASVVADLRGEAQIAPPAGFEYGFSCHKNNLTLILERPLAQLLAEAIYCSGEGEIPGPLWSLHSELRNFSQVIFRKAA
jgi:hypothetical protein